MTQFTGNPHNVKEVAAWIDGRIHDDLNTIENSHGVGEGIYKRYIELIEEVLSKREDSEQYDKKILSAIQLSGALGQCDEKVDQGTGEKKYTISLSEWIVVADASLSSDGSPVKLETHPEKLETALEKIFSNIPDAIAITKNLRNNFSDEEKIARNHEEYVEFINHVKDHTFLGDATNTGTVAEWIDLRIGDFLSANTMMCENVGEKYDDLICHVLEKRPDYKDFDLRVLSMLCGPNGFANEIETGRENKKNDFSVSKHRVFLADTTVTDLEKYVDDSGYESFSHKVYSSEDGVDGIFKLIPKAIAVTEIIKNNSPGVIESNMNFCDFRTVFDSALKIWEHENTHVKPVKPSGHQNDTCPGKYEF